jgi:plastocyanin domain-containing protein
MTAAQLVVTGAGILAIAWVNYYFFAAGRSAGVPAATDASGLQLVRIEVRGGYTPDVVRVRAGRPVRLDFFRNETNSCTEEVVIPEFGIRRYLPAHQTTAIEFTPEKAGEFEFACGMGMVRGKIEVQS